MFFRGGHRLGQIARLIDVVSSDDGQVIAEELKGNDIDDGLKGVHSLRNLMRN